jgi:hypothetical protein
VLEDAAASAGDGSIRRQLPTFLVFTLAIELSAVLSRLHHEPRLLAASALHRSS